MPALVGTTVAILEARRSAELASLLQHEGGSVYIAPVLREEPDEVDGEVASFIGDVCDGAFELLVLLTGVGTRTLVSAAERLGRRDELVARLSSLPLLCRGPKPVAALRTFELAPAYTTPSPFTTEQVLRVAAGLDLAGRRVGVVLHGGGAEELIDGLRALGASVQAVQVYHWALPDDVNPVHGLIERLDSQAIQAIAFTSASQIQNLIQIAERFGERESLLRLLAQVNPIVAVGPVCAAALRAYDLPVHVEPREPKMGPMVLALARYIEARIRAA